MASWWQYRGNWESRHYMQAMGHQEPITVGSCAWWKDGLNSVCQVLFRRALPCDSRARGFCPHIRCLCGLQQISRDWLVWWDWRFSIQPWHWGLLCGPCGPDIRRHDWVQKEAPTSLLELLVVTVMPTAWVEIWFRSCWTPLLHCVLQRSACVHGPTEEGGSHGSLCCL